MRTYLRCCILCLEDQSVQVSRRELLRGALPQPRSDAPFFIKFLEIINTFTKPLQIVYHYNFNTILNYAHFIQGQKFLYKRAL